MPTEREPQRDATPAKCQSCHGPMLSPAFCDNCRSLYPADGLSHFELLGLAPRYDLDAHALRQKYLQVSRGVHPDAHGNAESTLSLRLSAQLNEAHRVLADPVLRAEYLLELLGGKSAKEDKRVSPDVLGATVALREELQEAKASANSAALEACQAQARQYFATTLSIIIDLARQLPGDLDIRSRLRAQLNAIKYHQRLLSEF